VSVIVSVFEYDVKNTTQGLSKLFGLCEKLDVPIAIVLDGFEWWDSRPDLWNFFDKTKPG
jgi:hypothetical protein